MCPRDGWSRPLAASSHFAKATVWRTLSKTWAYTCSKQDCMECLDPTYFSLLLLEMGRKVCNFYLPCKCTAHMESERAIDNWCFCLCQTDQETTRALYKRDQVKMSSVIFFFSSFSLKRYKYPLREQNIWNPLLNESLYFDMKSFKKML